MYIPRRKGLAYALALFLVGGVAVYVFALPLLPPGVPIFPLMMWCLVGLPPGVSILVYLGLRERPASFWTVSGLAVVALLSMLFAILTRTAVTEEVYLSLESPSASTADVPLEQLRLYVETTLVISGFFGASALLTRKHRHFAALLLVSLLIVISYLFEWLYRWFPIVSSK